MWREARTGLRGGTRTSRSKPVAAIPIVRATVDNDLDELREAAVRLLGTFRVDGTT